MKYLLIGLALMIAGCQALPYKDDHAFINSGDAGRSEIPILVEGKPCVDYLDQPGACVVRIKSDDDLRLRMLPLGYGGNLNLDCGDSLSQYRGVYPVVPDHGWELTIKQEDMAELRLFSCKGKVVAGDRADPQSATFLVVVEIVFHEYTEREMPTVVDGRLVMGQYSRRVYYCRGKRCYLKKKKTSLRDAESIQYAVSESYRMRYNYVRQPLQN